MTHTKKKKEETSFKYLAILLVMIRRVIRCCICVIVASASGETFATDGPPTPDEVRSWIERAWNPASLLSEDRSFKIRWTVESHEVPETAVLQQLRSEVPGRPDHPEGPNLPKYEARAAGKYDTTELVWWSNPKKSIWRLNTTYDGPGERRVFDIGVGKEVQWGLGPEQLIVGSVRSPEPAYDYASMLGQYLANLNWAISGGLWSGYSNRLPPPTVTITGNSWTAVSRDAARGIEFKAAGRWNADGAVVTEVTSRKHSGEPDDWRARYVSSGGRFVPELGVSIPERVEMWYGEPLRPYRVFVVHELEFVDDTLVASLTALPGFNGSDPIRGANTFKSILDLREGARGYELLGEDGTITEVPLSATPAARHYSRLTMYGWISACAMVVALAAIRLRRGIDQRKRI